MIRNIIFDFDGTLMDTVDGIIATELATYAKMGLPTPEVEAMKRGIGLPLAGSLFASGVVPEERLDEAVETYRALFYSCAPDKVKMFEGVGETLAKMHAEGIRMAIATSRSKHSLEMFLENFKIAEFFEDMVTASDGLPSKPQPGMVLALLERMGLDRNETLVVGDTTFDIDMGAGAGCLTCGVTYGNHPAAKLSESSPTWLIDSFPALRDIVLKSACR